MRRRSSHSIISRRCCCCLTSGSNDNWTRRRLPRGRRNAIPSPPRPPSPMAMMILKEPRPRYFFSSRGLGSFPPPSFSSSSLPSIQSPFITLSRHIRRAIYATSTTSKIKEYEEESSATTTTTISIYSPLSPPAPAAAAAARTTTTVRDTAIHMLRCPSTRLEQYMIGATIDRTDDDDDQDPQQQQQHVLDFWQDVETVLKWLVASNKNNNDDDKNDTDDDDDNNDERKESSRRYRIRNNRYQDDVDDEGDGIEKHDRRKRTTILDDDGDNDDPISKIRHAIRLLDRLSDAIVKLNHTTYDDLQQQQRHELTSTASSLLIAPSSSLLLLPNKNAYTLHNHYYCQQQLPPMIRTDIFNDVLVAWRRLSLLRSDERRYNKRIDNNNNNNKKSLRRALPKASTMAEKLDRYSTEGGSPSSFLLLVEPDAKSYNIVLDVMLRTDGIKMTDHYLRSLINVANAAATAAATTTSSSSTNHDDLFADVEEEDDYGTKIIIDAISFGTVMKGWVEAGQPQKAQELLEEMIQLSSSSSSSKSSYAFRYCQPTTIAYTTVINGWARIGDANRAEDVLYKLLDYYYQHQQSSVDFNNTMMNDRRSAKPDRVLFHTVLDAWGRYQKQFQPKQAREQHESKRRETADSRNNKNESVQEGSDDQVAVDIVDRAQKLVKTMEELASSNSGAGLGDLIRPNIETWSRLISIVGESSDDKYGPRAAEQMLEELERSNADSVLAKGPGSGPSIVLYNRILHGYAIRSKDMDSAQEFFEDKILNGTFPIQPDDTTFNTLLAGWAQLPSKDRPGTPVQAEAWLRRMSNEFGVQPTPRSYSSVLLCWTKSWQHYDHAVQHAQDILNEMLKDMGQPPSASSFQPISSRDSSSSNSPTTTSSATVCYNIVLKGWADQSIRFAQERKHEKSRYAIGKANHLLGDLIYRHESSSSRRSEGILLDFRPTGVTFRFVLNGIAGCSTNASNKYNRALSIIKMMKNYGVALNKQDRKLLQRLKKKHDSKVSPNQSIQSK